MSRFSFFLVALVAGLASPVVDAAGEEGVEAMLAQVTALHEKAVAAGHEWLGTGGLLEQARRAAVAGREAEALELLRNAGEDCELALRQARREEDAWKDRVLR